jgi:hypothetical protein
MTNQVKRYNRRFVIPNWDKRDRTQVFTQSEDGRWWDKIEQEWRDQAWIDEHIAPYFKLAPSPLKTLEAANEV